MAPVGVRPHAPQLGSATVQPSRGPGLLLLSVALALITSGLALDNGVGKVPAMGWNR